MLKDFGVELPQGPGGGGRAMHCLHEGVPWHCLRDGVLEVKVEVVEVVLGQGGVALGLRAHEGRELVEIEDAAAVAVAVKDVLELGHGNLPQGLHRSGPRRGGGGGA